MQTPALLKLVLDGQAWSVSGLIYGLEELLDDEGRPVSERRAPSAVKQGVTIELRRCPYQDDRHGQPMNVSALAQITKHLDAVLEDIRAFRSSATSLGAGAAAASPGGDDFSDVLCAVIDQLAGPAVHVLRQRDVVPPVPARCAVGHKLAAGYFGVVREILCGAALGEPCPRTVAGVMQHVRKTRALHGASEVCAGPLPLIERTTDVLLRGQSDRRVPDARVAIAAALTQQVRLSIAWEIFDGACERALLLGHLHDIEWMPRTTIVRRALTTRIDELRAAPRVFTIAGALQALPGAGGAALLAGVRTAYASLLSGAAAAPQDTARADDSAQTLAELLARDEGAIALASGAPRDPIAAHLAGYFSGYRATLAALFAEELRLRQLLGYDARPPLRTNGVLFPAPRTLRWAEMLLGHWLRCTPTAQPAIIVSNPRRVVTLIAGDTPPEER